MHAPRSFSAEPKNLYEYPSARARGIKPGGGRTRKGGPTESIATNISRHHESVFGPKQHMERVGVAWEGAGTRGAVPRGRGERRSIGRRLPSWCVGIPRTGVRGRQGPGLRLGRGVMIGRLNASAASARRRSRSRSRRGRLVGLITAAVAGMPTAARTACLRASGGLRCRTILLRGP